MLWKTKPGGLQKRGEVQPSDVVMNPKQVFFSVLIFGAAGLLLFMYLQVWIEEQHTGNPSTFFLSPLFNYNGHLLLDELCCF